MKDVAWTKNPESAWNRFLRFIAVIEESMDRDLVTPLSRRVDALEREIEELGDTAARNAAISSKRVAG